MACAAGRMRGMYHYYSCSANSSVETGSSAVATCSSLPEFPLASPSSGIVSPSFVPSTLMMFRNSSAEISFNDTSTKSCLSSLGNDSAYREALFNRSPKRRRNDFDLYIEIPNGPDIVDSLSPRPSQHGRPKTSQKPRI